MLLLALFTLGQLQPMGVPSRDLQSSIPSKPSVPFVENPPADVLVVVGEPGTTEYSKDFFDWAYLWQLAAKKGGAGFTLIAGQSPIPKTTKEQVRQYLKDRKGNSPLWIVLIGHGTDDGRECRFNLVGPDFTALELKDWVADLKRPMAIIHCGSSSAPFLKALSAPGRVVITATRSGSESNFCRFGQYLSQAWADPKADLDRDGQVSLLEAFLLASAGVAEFYKSEGRLATEHALLDDNGDGLGSQADWFQGIRSVKKAKDGAEVDGPRAHQWHLMPNESEKKIPAIARKKRDELELELIRLREKKTTMPEDKYYLAVESILVELGKIYLGPNAEGTQPQ